MSADVKIDSLELLRQYQGHLRNFSDCVDAGIVLFRDQLRKKKDEIFKGKDDLECRFVSVIDRLDDRIYKLEDLQHRFIFSQEDFNRIEIEKNRYISQRNSFMANLENVKGKIERQISILDDLWNLTYSYGNRSREMSNTANGTLSSIIGQISKYKAK